MESVEGATRSKKTRSLDDFLDTSYTSTNPRKSLQIIPILRIFLANAQGVGQRQNVQATESAKRLRRSYIE